jgi:hypothetical protein
MGYTVIIRNTNDGIETRRVYNVPEGWTRAQRLALSERCARRGWKAIIMHSVDVASLDEVTGE